MPVLLCRHLDRRIDWKVTLPDGDFTIGCSDGATVPVPDATLAPREVLISRKGERYLLQDIAERGQVIFGGTVTRTGLLKDGDRFRIGRVSFLFIENARDDSGEVELYRDAAPSLDLLDTPVPSLDARRAQRKIPDDVQIPRGVWVGVLVLAIFTGMCLGVLFTGGGATESSATTRPASADGAVASAIAQARAEGPAPGDAGGVRRLADPSNQERPARTPDPSPAAAVMARKRVPQRFLLEAPLDARTSRLWLFRVFLDLVGRPPTRGEEKALAGLDLESRWRRIAELAAREGAALDPTEPIEAQVLRVIGRNPSLEEAQEITAMVTSELPALFWIMLLDDYRRPQRRRTRSPSVQARSFIVDLLDRAPRNGEEVEAVRAALAGSGAALEAARTLVHSPEGRDLAANLQDEWRDEAFRFLLRPLTAAEESELGSLWSQRQGADRGAWLLIALATQEDYGKY